MRIEDLAIIGDNHSVAVVGRDGDIKWLCLPRIDSGACFASLLGGPEHGRWLIAPRAGDVVKTERRYREGSLVLETDFHVRGGGVVRVTDAMPARDESPSVVRVVEGIEGSADVEIELALRFDYGRAVPWVRRLDSRLRAVAGPNAVVLASPAELSDRDYTTVAHLTIRRGERVPFVLTWYPSWREPPESPDAERSIEETDRWWRDWASRAKQSGYRDAVVRSLLTLKALTYAPTGGIIAAPTTSLPEVIGGGLNWDYRYCWIRDASFTLYAMLHAGYHREAEAWRDWLLRAVAGSPASLQSVYGAAGERYLDERTLDCLPGYEGSRPVRVGNAATSQLQLDVYGEVLDALHQARRLGVRSDPAAWPLQRTIADWLESNWRQKCDGIWETRGERKHFTLSKVMAWTAMDRAVKAVEQHGMEGPVARWKRARAAIHAEVCERGYDAEIGSFTQSYGSKRIDASTLLIPSVGFLPPDDPRVAGTIRTVERELIRHGFVFRYDTDEGKDREGAFLACSFWLVDAYVLGGRIDEARALFERVLSVRNDLGLLSEEYDPIDGRLVGNFPQAFSHVALVNSARNLTTTQGPAHHRRHT